MDFSSYIRKSEGLVIQPRMGFSNISKMSEGLNAVRNVDYSTVGTITVDSYTRLNMFDTIDLMLEKDIELNGYPIVSHSVESTKSIVDKLIENDSFTVQVRHGTALPRRVFETILACGIGATEGGPVSYCLPYGRIPLSEAIKEWGYSCSLASEKELFHIESFAGCMLGQLCPPSMSIALNVLECLFFRNSGIKSCSLSFAQGTNLSQDVSAIVAMNYLADKYLYDMSWHIVVYTFMGVFPETHKGCVDLIRDSVKICTLTRSERLIVKTTMEARGIPTIRENIECMNLAHSEYVLLSDDDISNYFDVEEYESILEEANDIIISILNVSADISKALHHGVQKGLLDIPFCMHPDNNNKSNCYIDEAGYLKWNSHGNIAIKNSNSDASKQNNMTSSEFINMLSYVRLKYDLAKRDRP